jgi:hypothetical protein
MNDIECLRKKLYVFEIFRSVDQRFGVIWDIPYKLVCDTYDKIPDFDTVCDTDFGDAVDIRKLAEKIQADLGGPIQL